MVSNSPTVPEVHTEKNSELSVEEQASSLKFITEKLPIPYRFTLVAEEFVTHFEGVLKDITDKQDSIEPPCVRAKLEAVLEYILVKKLGISYNYHLIDDHGWPVPRKYVMVPKSYTLHEFEFSTTILLDNSSLFILLDFGPLSYKLIACSKNMVPFVDYSRNTDKIFHIYKVLLKSWFIKIHAGKALPRVPFYEKEFINAKIPTETECLLSDKEKNEVYLRVESADATLNPINSTMPPLYRLYRAIFAIIRDHGFLIKGDKSKDRITLQETYSSEDVRVLYEGLEFHITLLEGLMEYFFIVKDSKLEYISGHRIPLKYLPTFGVGGGAIHIDNVRLVELNIFLGVLLTTAYDDMQEATRSRSNSRRSSISEFDPYFSKVPDMLEFSSEAPSDSESGN